MSRLEVHTLSSQMSDGLGAKENHEPNILHLQDRVTLQERVHDFPHMPHLAKEDVVIELVAWAIALSVLFTALRLAGTL